MNEDEGNCYSQFKLADLLRGMDDCQYIESVVVYHAAPTLQGIKPATMVNVRGEKRALAEIWPCCKERLISQLGIQVQELRQKNGGLLLLIYRPELLSSSLEKKGAQQLLAKRGYPINSTIEEQLDHLTKRFEDEAVPHEIGIFLGYPLQDVHGFIRYNGAGCKEVGHWKVYGNVNRARQEFRKYREATGCAATLLSQGADLLEIRRNFHPLHSSGALA